jgi:uncharacterized phage protein (TIGR01671 family)
MREIKYKAWNKTEKRWINLNGLSIEFEGCANPGKVYSITEQGVLKEISLEEIELCEFTGLKDKSGEEIYEGDKLRGRHGFTTVADMIEFRIYVSNNYSWFTDQEIIGNIYENNL